MVVGKSSNRGTLKKKRAAGAGAKKLGRSGSKAVADKWW